MKAVEFRPPHPLGSNRYVKTLPRKYPCGRNDRYTLFRAFSRRLGTLDPPQLAV